MILQEEYNLNLEPQLSKKYVKVSQYDTGRRLLITLIKNDGSMFKIPLEASASINGLKPDGNGFRYDCSIENNKVVVDMKEQMTVLAGYVKCEILLSKGGERIATANFMLNVEESPLSENTPISSTDIPLLQKAIEASEIVLSVEKTVKGYSESASKSAQNSQASAESAVNASNASAESANSASQSATNASAKATEAKKSETNAKLSETNASNSAKKAQTSAESAIQTKAEIEQLKKETIEQASTLTESAKQEISTVKDATVTEVTELKNSTVSEITTLKDSTIEAVTLLKDNAKAEADRATESSASAKVQAEKAQASADSVANVVSDVSQLKEDVSKLQKRQNIIVGSETGNPISCDDVFAAPLCGLHIYGKSTQDGTPTPDAPVPIVSVGDGGSVTVKVTGKNLFPTQYRQDTRLLHYNAQSNQWDFEPISGQFVNIRLIDPEVGTFVLNAGTYNISLKDAKNVSYISINSVNVNDNNDWKKLAAITNNGEKTFSIQTKSKIGCFFVPTDETLGGYIKVQLELGTTATSYSPYSEKLLTIPTPNGLPGIPVNSDGNYTDQSGQQWVCDEVDLERGVKVQRVDKAAFDSTKTLVEQNAILATPIETPLTTAEIATYKALITYSPNTVVQASDGAGIKLDYQRDVNLVIKNLEDAIASITNT